MWHIQFRGRAYIAHKWSSIVKGRHTRALQTLQRAQGVTRPSLCRPQKWTKVCPEFRRPQLTGRKLHVSTHLQSQAAAVVRLADYTPYPYELQTVNLDFTLRGDHAEVQSTLKVTPLQ
ncbi:hypothetical protein SARC_14161, partial [Sphaeroforma arctica JP610]